MLSYSQRTFQMAVCALVGALALIVPQADATPIIESISVCDGNGTCQNGSVDTAQPVLGPNGQNINDNGGLTTLADEHSTILPPGTLPGQTGFLFFEASRTAANSTSSGLAVLTNVADPTNGQWTLGYAQSFGNYGSQNGQIFLSAMAHNECPSVGSISAQDPTFDLNYADPGSIIINPTSPDPSRGVMMVYEGTNRCIGLTNGNNVQQGNSFYSTVGVATSLSYGQTWPVYASNFFDSSNNPVGALPGQNPSQGPNDPFGASGNQVCYDVACIPGPDGNFGRYAVIGPPTTVADAMTKPTVVNNGLLLNHVGNAAPSAFVDNANSGQPAYLYVVDNYDPGKGLGNPPLSDGQPTDLVVSRALLGGSGPLAFTNWFQGSFNSPNAQSLGGDESPISFDAGGGFANCEGPHQIRTMGSISYVEAAQQYLLTFVCMSQDGDPAGVGLPGSGAAWFFSTNSDLSKEDQWNIPQEITGSWNPYDNTPGCPSFAGWYPSLMSMDQPAGDLSSTGYIFYLNGCSGGEVSGTRAFSSRQFDIQLSSVPEPGTLALFGAGLAGFGAMRCRCRAKA
jgi:hypothetical protein